MLVNGENESDNDTDSDEESSDEDQETPETEKVRTYALDFSLQDLEGVQLSFYFVILITGDWFSLGWTKQEEICRVSYEDPCSRKEGKAGHSPKDRQVFPPICALLEVLIANA